MQLNYLERNPFLTGMLFLFLAWVLGSAGLGNAGSVPQQLAILYSGNTSGFTEPSG